MDQPPTDNVPTVEGALLSWDSKSCWKNQGLRDYIVLYILILYTTKIKISF